MDGVRDTNLINNVLTYPFQDKETLKEERWLTVVIFMSRFL